MDIVNYILGNRYKGSGGYDKTTTLSWDGTVADESLKTVIYEGNFLNVFIYKISDNVPSKNEAIGAKITIISIKGNSSQIFEDELVEDKIISSDGCFIYEDVGIPVIFFVTQDGFDASTIGSASFESTSLKKGTYFCYIDTHGALSMYMSSLSYKTPIPLQNKFIPLAEDGVKGGIVGTAKTDDMLTPVGIDENGKLFAESQFYDTRDTKDLVMTFDGNLEGKEYIGTESGMYFVKYSDYVPPYDSVNYIHTTFASNGSEQTGNLTKDNLSYVSDDNLIAYGINGNALNFIYSGSMTIGDKTMTQGAWVAYVKSDDVTNIYKEITINYNVGELKQIDKKYIPEQKPLTFTGAVTGTYDGSEALEVNIPEGGGTGNEWELIVDVTLTETASKIIIDKDLSGESFSLRRAILYVKLINTSSTDGESYYNSPLKLFGKNQYVASFVIGNVPTSDGEAIISMAEFEKTAFGVFLSEARTSFNKSSMPVTVYKTDYNFIQGGDINSQMKTLDYFELQGSGAFAGVGSIVKIYGIRE